MSWVEKYHPIKLESLVTSPQIHCILDQILDNPSEMSNLILYGPPGTGKSSTVDCIISKLYENKNRHIGGGGERSSTKRRKRRGPLDLYYLKLNAGRDRSIDQFEKMKIYAQRMAYIDPITKKHVPRLIVLDESDAMTDDLQWSMRQLIENVSKTCRFIFVCNQIEKMLPPLKSRCFLIAYPPLRFDWCCPRLELICREENVQFDSPEKRRRLLQQLMRQCGWDMRKTINTLQALQSMCGGGGENIQSSHIEMLVGQQMDLNILQEFLSDVINRGAHKHAVDLIQSMGYSTSCLVNGIQKWAIEQMEDNGVKREKVIVTTERWDSYFFINLNRILLQALEDSQIFHEIRIVLYKMTLAVEDLFLNNNNPLPL